MAGIGLLPCEKCDGNALLGGFSFCVGALGRSRMVGDAVCVSVAGLPFSGIGMGVCGVCIEVVAGALRGKAISRCCSMCFSR